MTQPAVKNTKTVFLQILPAILLVIGFFIPWVSWDKFNIKGADLPLGNFFAVSEKNFLLGNPFPQFNFAFFAFWLIPAFAVLIIILILLKKGHAFASVLTGLLALSAATIYLLFSINLSDLGVNYSLKPGIYLSALAAVAILLTSSINWLPKIVFTVIGPLCVWAGFTLTADYLMNKKHDDTANTKADYAVNAQEMIKEFQTSDSLANAKYVEKIIEVTGNISAIEKPNDSTVNIKFIDTTTGSYLIFPFEGKSVQEVEKLKPEDTVSLKGSCSGAVYSEILGAWFISFKRSVLNKN